MSGFTLTPTNPVTDTVRPPAGKYRHIIGDGTNGTINLALYRMDSTGAITLLQPPAYTTEQVQDDVAALFTDSNQVDFTYNDLGNAETARVLMPVQTLLVATNKVYSAADIGRYFRRSNAGVAMADSLPTLTAADNGFAIKVINLDLSASITFTGAGGETIGEAGATSYELKYGCRQTFVWNGTGWSFDAGSGNLLKTYSGAAAGDLLAMLDSKGIVTRKATSTDLAATSNNRYFVVNVLDYGADRTGVTSSATAVTNAVAAIVANAGGGIVWFPAGTYNLGNAAWTLSSAHVTLRGSTRYNTNITTTSTSADILVVGQYYNAIEDLTFIGPGSSENPTRTAGYAINTNTAAGAANTEIRRCTFFYQFSCINLASSLSNVEDIDARYYKGNIIDVDHNSDHQVSQVICNNNPAFPNTGGAGIRVKQCASLQMDNLNMINCWFALDIAPAVGVTTPSIKGVNCFFDTSVVGLNMTSAGSFLRSEFTNCWFSSMSEAGVKLAPTTAGGVNGITFVNCDIYNNVGGVTTGVNTNTNVSKWKMTNCSVAGWTVGVNLVAGATHFPTILGNTIGAVSAFGVNGTGIVIGAGAFRGFLLLGNDVVDNTVNITIGAWTAVVSYQYHRIIDNAGINPRNTSSAPVLGASNTVHTNTTGFRCAVVIKASTTAPTQINVSGLATGAMVANQSVVHQLDPGDTIQITWATTTPTWTWQQK